MQAKYCEKTIYRKRADGEIYEYKCQQKYYTKGKLEPISAENQKKIKELHELGVPVKRISERTGVSVYRVNKLVKL